MKETAILVTTFLRDECLFRCVKSIRQFYKDLPIFIGDNGHHTDEKRAFAKSHDCKYIELPFDCGVGGTRNEALKLIPKKYKFVTIVEDDIVFTEETKLEKWRRILDSDKRIGIVGGMLILGNGKEQHYEGTHWIEYPPEGNIKYVRQLKDPEWKKEKGVRYCFCDLILNVFMMRKAVWSDVQWDERFKTALEHADFFLSLKYLTVDSEPMFDKNGRHVLRKNPWKIAYIPDVKLIHQHEVPSIQYRQYRGRPVGFHLFAEKWNIKISDSDFNMGKQIRYDNFGGFVHTTKDEILRRMVKIFERHKVKWWLNSGTCLGAVREMKFIGHDPDMDVGIAPGQLRLWPVFLKEFADAGFTLYREWIWKDQKIQLSFKLNDVKLDIFFYYEKDDKYWYGAFSPDEQGRWGQFMQCVPRVLPKELFEHPQPLLFRGERCFIPDPPVKYLELHYGTDWRIPKENWCYWKDNKAIDKDFFNPKPKLETPPPPKEEKAVAVTVKAPPAIKKEEAPVNVPAKATIAVGIKTFMREATLFKSLDAIEKNFPHHYRLYIADDSRMSDEKEYRYQQLEKQGHIVIRLPFDCGLSFGRNSIINRAKEDFILIMDDDIRIDSPKTVEAMLEVLKNADDNVGLVAGVLECENGMPWGGGDYGYGIRFVFENDVLYRWPADKTLAKFNGHLYKFADQVVNFFLAKREMFRDISWDNRIKIEWEHMDFFLRLKKTRWKAAVCLDAKAVHMRPEDDFLYTSHRRSAASQYFMQKHGLKAVLNKFQ